MLKKGSGDPVLLVGSNVNYIDKPDSEASKLTKENLSESPKVASKKAQNRGTKPRQQAVRDIDFNTISNLIKEWWTTKSRDFILGKVPDNVQKQQSAKHKSDEKDDIHSNDSIIKVDAFIKGELGYSLEKLNIAEKISSNGAQTYLPRIDKNAQIALRRKILIENLNRG